MNPANLADRPEHSTCDICSAPNPQYAYPCRDFAFCGVAASRGGWDACQACHDLIEREDRAALADRAIPALLRENPWASREVLKEMILELHDLFFANRIMLAPMEVN